MAATLLTKGGNVALPTDLDELNVGLSWDAPGPGYDLDAWTFALGPDGRVLADEYFVFFNNMASPCGSIRVSEDNQEGGSAEEDDEVVTVRLAAVPAAVQRIVFLVNIYGARGRRQSFGSLDNAAIRLFSPRTGEVTRYNLGRGDTSTEASLVFGELYRHGGGWKFRAVAQGSDRGPGRDKDLGLILHVAYTDGRRTYFDWGHLTDKQGAIVHHGDRAKGGTYSYHTVIAVITTRPDGTILVGARAASRR